MTARGTLWKESFAYTPHTRIHFQKKFSVHSIIIFPVLRSTRHTLLGESLIPLCWGSSFSDQKAIDNFQKQKVPQNLSLTLSKCYILLSVWSRVVRAKACWIVSSLCFHIEDRRCIQISENGVQKFFEFKILAM